MTNGVLIRELAATKASGRLWRQHPLLGMTADPELGSQFRILLVGRLVATARRQYYQWILKSPGDLRQFTYCYNGRASNINITTDIIDHVISFVV